MSEQEPRDPLAELVEARDALVEAIIVSLRLPEIVAWLNRKLVAIQVRGRRRP